LLRQIAAEEPRPPRRLDPRVPVGLETVVLKALAKDAGERYATAGELGDDLQRFLADQPVRARRPTRRERAARWARRHRGAVRAAAAALVVTTLGLAAVSAALWRQRDRVRAAQQHEAAERRRAEENLALAVEALDRVLRVAEERFPRDPQREAQD